MANPVWLTKSGNLGTIQERQFYQFELLAENATNYEVISGSLPQGLALASSGTINGTPSVKKLVKGVPFDVGSNISSRFVVRAKSGTSFVSDRTFELTVTGQDKPQILTTNKSLGSFIEGQYVQVKVEAIDLDSDELTWALSEFELPPGLTIDPKTGVISGYIEPQLGNQEANVGYDLSEYDEFEFDFTTKSIDRNYLFNISVTDGKDIVQQAYTIFVYSRNNLSADNTNISADFIGAITADQEQLRTPILETVDSDIGDVFHDDYFAYQFFGKDFDGDQIEFIIDVDESSLSLPPGLILDATSGWLYGHLEYQFASKINYNFNVKVRKKDRPEYSSEPKTFTITVLGDSNRDVTWTTPSNLGVIYAGDISTLYVQAEDINRKKLKYSLDNYQLRSLPQGLQFTSDGILTGRVGFETFSIDGNDTTFDQRKSNYRETTFDSEFTFEVTARDASELISSKNVFTITVSKRTSEPYENLYVRALPDLELRKEYTNFINNLDIFKPELIYRNNDIYFGKPSDIRMLILPGVVANFASTFISAMSKYHYNKTLKFGDIKTARALNDDGTVKYEVVYIEIMDDIDNLSKSVSLHPAVKKYTGRTSLYPNSLKNMRQIIIDELGLETTKVYPEWMTSVQEDGNVLNWVPAVVLAYTKPGFSKQLAYDIENISNFDFKKIKFEIDRYIWDADLSDNFDKTFREFDQKQETTFDRSNSSTFIGDGSTTVFRLARPITGNASILVTIDNVTIDSVTYRIEVDSVIFETAPTADSLIIIQDHDYTIDIAETTFDKKTTRFITDVIGYREKDFRDKYLKFPKNGVLD